MSRPLFRALRMMTAPATCGPARLAFRRDVQAVACFDPRASHSPHRFRNAPAETSNRCVTTAKGLKAVSMHLGHSCVQMSVDRYGRTSPHRKGEVVKPFRNTARQPPPSGW